MTVTNKPSYRDKTYNSRNPLARYAHRSRFQNSVDQIDLTDGLRILDFGCGDGYFLNQLATIAQDREVVDVEYIGFEPYMDAVPGNQVQILRDWISIKAISAERKFDYVTCFEVFEHFSGNRQGEALEKICDVLSNRGRLIISVPIEKGFPAVVKNVIRRVSMPKNKHIYSLSNIFVSMLGKPLKEFRTGDQYLSHMGK